MTKTCSNIWNNQANILHFSYVLTGPFDNVSFESKTYESMNENHIGIGSYFEN